MTQFIALKNLLSTLRLLASVFLFLQIFSHSSSVLALGDKTPITHVIYKYRGGLAYAHLINFEVKKQNIAGFVITATSVSDCRKINDIKLNNQSTCAEIIIKRIKNSDTELIMKVINSIMSRPCESFDKSDSEYLNERDFFCNIHYVPDYLIVNEFQYKTMQKVLVSNIKIKGRK